jgi:hypothetical protein
MCHFGIELIKQYFRDLQGILTILSLKSSKNTFTRQMQFMARLDGRHSTEEVVAKLCDLLLGQNENGINGTDFFVFFTSFIFINFPHLSESINHCKSFVKPWIEPFRITLPSLCASAVISLTSKSTPGRQYAPSLQDKETVTAVLLKC